MIHPFNVQVLQQVMKDGTVYKSLAKEMAAYILGQGKPQSEIPGSFRAAITQDLTGGRMRMAKRNGIYIIEYFDCTEIEDYDTYQVNILRPEDL